MTYVLRYPDKPHDATPEFLESLDSRARQSIISYAATLKFDGYRALLVTQPDGSFHGYTRHGKRMFEALKRDDDFAPEINESIRSLNLPSGLVLDCEWLGRRQIAHFEDGEALVVIDILYQGGDWVGHLPFIERQALLSTLIPPHHTNFDEHLGVFKRGAVWLAGFFTDNLAACYTQRAAANEPLVEGIVLKGLTSRLVGGWDECKLNKHWWKIKWR